MVGSFVQPKLVAIDGTFEPVKGAFTRPISQTRLACITYDTSALQ